MSTKPQLWQHFAAADDALLAGTLDSIAAAGPVAPALAVAQRLRREAEPGVPDPAFVGRLRAELLARRSATVAAGAPLHFSSMATPVGRLWLAYDGGRVVRCSFAEGAEGTGVAALRAELVALTGHDAIADAEPPATLARGIREHLAGRRRFRDVDLSRLTPFQRRVLEKAAEIPRGEVRPYGWIAREIGAPGATRAVGTALGHNPIPVLIPCHRVVRTDGTLGEYSGGGPAVKSRILAFEGLAVSAMQEAFARGERLRGSRTTHIVCYPSCHAAARILTENAVSFPSLAAAERTGYRPCRRCRPA